MEEKFLLQFQEEDKYVSLGFLRNTKQEESVSAQAFINKWRNLSYKRAEPPSRKAAVNMCKDNLKPEIKAMMVSLKTKSLAKLREVVVHAENVHKGLTIPSWSGPLTRRSDIELSSQEDHDPHKQIQRGSSNLINSAYIVVT